MNSAPPRSITRNALCELLPRVIDIARAAGAVIKEVYACDSVAVRSKPDRSPVTEADELAERLIVSRLRALAPDIPIVAEEAVARGETADTANRLWLVDPLDGTKEFIDRNGEFTVNVALIEDGTPVLGVVYAPAIDRMFAAADGVGAFCLTGADRRALRCRLPSSEGLTVVTSRSHGDATAMANYLRDKPVASVIAAGSSLKLCLVAAGEADLYPRLGRTMEWDIAAGHAVLRSAGGEVRSLADGSLLRYGKPGFENPHFVAQGLVA